MKGLCRSSSLRRGFNAFIRRRKDGEGLTCVLAMVFEISRVLLEAVSAFFVFCRDMVLAIVSD